MQRIRTILQKLNELAQQNTERNVIDVDLMLDYTRVIYADLLELRASVAPKGKQEIHEPTLDELTKAMEAAAAAEEEEAFPQPVLSTARMQAAPHPVAPEPVKTPEPAPLPVAPVPAPQPAPARPPVPPPGFSQPVKDIRRFIDLNEKYLFLSELFHNDMRAYEDIMTRLNGCQSKPQAVQLLGSKFMDESNSAYHSFHQMLDRFFE